MRPGPGCQFQPPAATSGAAGLPGPAVDSRILSPAIADPSRFRSRRVLVVDDHPGAGRSMARLLELVGHDVRLATNGPRALMAALDFAPDIVFLDLGLPGMDGTEVARCLRRTVTLRRAALVALTGWGGDDDRRRTTAAGFDFHLVKPVELAVIESVIDTLPD